MASGTYKCSSVHYTRVWRPPLASVVFGVLAKIPIHSCVHTHIHTHQTVYSEAREILVIIFGTATRHEVESFPASLLAPGLLCVSGGHYWGKWKQKGQGYGKVT